MKARYSDVRATAAASLLEVGFTLENRSAEPWHARSGQHIGSQIYDPANGVFITEGEWSPIAVEVAPGARQSVSLRIAIPSQDGPYRVYVSPLDEKTGWSYASGEFVVIDAVVERGHIRNLEARVTTLAQLRRREAFRSLPKLLTLPVRTIAANHRLIASMVRRDILSRYRGSFGDTFWTVLNPLLLMSTYFFVFGIVLHDPAKSRTDFAFYFLAGFLPWLPMSEAIGRAPSAILEQRNLVKKLVFPVETLPVNHVLAGFVTELFALAIYLVAFSVARGFPTAVVWLPALMIPQLLLTLGLCWFLAATGAFVRDLAQVIGFVLTLWFFVTPICYAEGPLLSVVPALQLNPLFILVRGYRAVFLDGHAPDLAALGKLWIVAVIVCIFGHAWFHKLRKSFADVI